VLSTTIVHRSRGVNGDLKNGQIFVVLRLFRTRGNPKISRQPIAAGPGPAMTVNYETGKTVAACVFGCFGLRPNFPLQKKSRPSIPTRTRCISICIRIRNSLQHEIQTAAKLAGRLRSLGYDVTDTSVVRGLSPS